MADLSEDCFWDRCRDCSWPGCEDRCHEDQEWDFVYGWQVRESYDRSSSDGG